MRDALDPYARLGRELLQSNLPFKNVIKLFWQCHLFEEAQLLRGVGVR
jgi:hypothetical protein